MPSQPTSQGGWTLCARLLTGCMWWERWLLSFESELFPPICRDIALVDLCFSRLFEGLPSTDEALLRLIHARKTLAFHMPLFTSSAVTVLPLYTI